MTRALCVLVALAAADVRGDTTPPPPDAGVAHLEDERAVLGVVERYRRALERLDAPALLALAHPRYHDRSGTAGPEDDIDYATLGTILGARLRAVRVARVKMTTRRVIFDGARARVEIEGESRMQLRTGGRWLVTSAPYVIALERDADRWLITSGM